MRIRALLLLGLLCCGLLGWSQNRHWHHYGVEDGLPSSNVYTIRQDNRGIIWMGTDKGLVRFDGSQFRVYSVDNNLENDDIWGMAPDPAGRIWLLSFSPSLHYLLGDSVHRVPLDLGLDQRPVRDFVTDSHSVRFALAHYPSDQQEIRLPKNSEGFPEAIIHPDPPYYSGTDALGNSLWITPGRVTRPEHTKSPDLPDTLELIIRGRDGNLREELPLVLDTGEWALQYIVMRNHQTIVVRTNKALHCLNYLTLEHVQHPYDYFFDGFKGQASPAISVSDDLILLRYRGEVLITTKELEKHNLLEGISGFKIQSFFKDREGNLWFGTPNHGAVFVSVLSENVRNVGFGPYLNPHSVTAVQALDRDRVVLGLNNGELRLWPDTANPVKLQDVLPVANSNSLVIRKIRKFRDQLWIRTPQRVYRASGIRAPLDQWRWESYEDWGLPQLYPKDMIPDDDDHFWLATASGTYRINTNAQQPPDTINRLRSQCLARSSDGTLWIGTTRGLFRYNERGLLFMGTPFPLLKHSVRFLAAEGDSVLWIGFQGKGIYRLEGDELEHIQGTQSLQINQIELGDGLLVAHNQGILQVRPKKSKRGFSVRELPIIGGTPTAEIMNLSWYGGVIYAGTNKGLSIIRPNALRQPAPSGVVMTRVTTGRDTLPLTGNVLLDFDQNNLHFEFAGISFHRLGQLEYRYRLRPGGEEETTSEPYVSFASLAPGTYKFDVVAVTPGGERSAPARYVFTIKAHWIREPWVIALLVLVGLALVAVVYRWRLRAIRKGYQAKLAIQERMTELETKALSAQMNPHFIFNCLNSLQFLILDGKNDKAHSYIARFGRLIRLNLETSGEKRISLQQELDRLSLYVDLEKMRLDGNLEFTVVTDPVIDCEQETVPNMILQPLIENAIVHGFQRDEPAKNAIEVSINKSDSGLTILIDDNGIGLDHSGRSDQKTGHQSLGFSLIRERLESTQQDGQPPSHLEVSDRKDEHGESVGTRVKLVLASAG